MQGLVELVYTPGPSTVLYGRHLINIWGGRVRGKREKEGMEGGKKCILCFSFDHLYGILSSELNKVNHLTFRISLRTLF